MTILTIICLIWIIRRLSKAEERKRWIKTQRIRVCSHCGEYIPYGAEVCPYCHNKPGRDWMADHQMRSIIFRQTIGNLFYGLCLLLIIVFILGCL